MVALQDAGVDVSTAIVLRDKIWNYIQTVGNNPSGDWNQLVACLVEFDAEVTRLENGAPTSGSMQDFGIDTTALETAISQADYAVANSNLYTPESFADFNTGDGILTATQIIQASKDNLAKTDWLNADIAQHNADVSLSMLNHILDKLVLATGEQDPAKDAQIEALREQIDLLIAEIEPLAIGTDYQQRYEDLELARIVVITSKANFVDWYGWNYWYNYAIPELERIANELTALKAEIVISQDTDLTKLQENYNKYNSLNEADYTPESWAEFLKFVNEDVFYLAPSTEALLADPEGFLGYPAYILNQWWEQAFALLAAKDNNQNNGGDNTDNSNNGGNDTDNNNNQNGNTDNNSNTNQDENNNNSSDPSNTNSNTNKASNKTATNNNTKDTTNLPQTGDTPTNMLISGLTMLGASIITILVRRRKKA